MLYSFFHQAITRLIGDTHKTGTLHRAVKAGSLETVRQLLDEGIHPNARDPQNNTPLHGAAQNGHGVIVALLLERGALPNTQNAAGHTPLHSATLARHQGIVHRLLQADADPNILNNYGITPLHWAAEDGDLAIVDLLVQAKADPNSRDKVGNTPLHKAANYRRESVMKRLLAQGADADPKNQWGETPLHLVICQSAFSISMLALLLSHGADITLKNPCNIKSTLDFLTEKQIKPIKHQVITNIIASLGLPQDKITAAELHFRIGRKGRIYLRVLSNALCLSSGTASSIVDLPLEILGLIFACLFADKVCKMHPLLGSLPIQRHDLDGLKGSFSTLIENSRLR